MTASRFEYDHMYIETILGRYDIFVDLNDILTEAGFESVEDNPDIDFTNIKKNTIIDILK